MSAQITRTLTLIKQSKTKLDLLCNLVKFLWLIYGYEPTIHLLSRLTFLTFSAGRAALQLFEITSKLTFTPSVL